MKYLTKRVSINLIIGILLASCVTNYAFARHLPDNYPIEYQWTGKVLSITNNTIFVNDTAIKILPSTSFYSTSTYGSSLSKITIGMHVGCVIDDNGNALSIWQFPKELESVTGMWSDDGNDDLD